MTNNTRASARQNTRQAADNRRSKRTGRGGQHDTAIVDIDPADQRDADDFEPPRRGPKSPWTTQLERLVDLLEAGQLAAGKYVKIGDFRSAQGAQMRADELISRRDSTSDLEPMVADGWQFRYRWHTIEGGSELWACITTTGAR